MWCPVRQRTGGLNHELGIYVDLASCIGCKTCQVACKDKNRLGVGPVLRKVASRQVGTTRP